MVQVGFGSCVSWRERQTEPLIPRNTQPHLPEQSGEPSLPVLPHNSFLQRSEFPSPALAISQESIGAQRGSTLPSLLLITGRMAEGQIPVLYTRKSPDCQDSLNSPSKSAPNQDNTGSLGEREVLSKRQHTERCSKVVQLSTTPWSPARIIYRPRCLHHSTGISCKSAEQLRMEPGA